MQRIIISDIFGKTKDLEKMSKSLSGTIKIFDPYDSALMDFNSEQDAYSHFMSEVGLNNYTANFLEYLSEFHEPVSLLGFSVGASVIWKISENKKFKNITGALCFYSSQIRNYREVVPCFSIQLVFPCRESHFSVSELIADLKNTKRVKIHQSQYLHGFMNFHSQNFNQKAQTIYLKALCNVPFNKCIQATAFGGA